LKSFSRTQAPPAPGENRRKDESIADFRLQISD
jgi:hypothetical protein